MPLLTIVIPTRNRISYAIHSIRSVLNIPSMDLELVVHDASDSRDLETYLATHISDGRLRYRHASRPLSLVENFDAAARIADSEYVSFIGDDDGVPAEIVKIAQWAKINNIDSVRSNIIASYFWPDVKAYDALKKQAGALVIYRFSGKISFPDVGIETLKCIHNGGQGYLNRGLPKPYHGLVKKELLDRVCEITGHFFGGLSPDVYGAIALTKIARRVASIDYPLTIGGTSANSGAGTSSTGRHRGRLEDAPHLRNRRNYPWPDNVPRIYTVQTIWAESVFAALKETGQDELLSEFRLPRLCALTLVANPDMAGEIIKEMYRILKIMRRCRFAGTVELLFSVVSSQTLRTIAFGARKVRSLMAPEAVRIEGLDDIGQAVLALEAYIDKFDRHFSPSVNARNLARGKGGSNA